MDKIQFVGLNELEEVDQQMVKTLVDEYYGKIQRALHNETGMKIHIKKHTKGGARQKYSVHVQAKAPTKLFESSHADDWDLASAVHKACEDVQKQIEHAFHNDPTWKTKSGKKGQQE